MKSIINSHVLRGVAQSIAAVPFIFSQLASPLSAGTIKEITNFGDNPTNLKMYLYTPTNVKTNPAVLVGLHWCHGTYNSYYIGNKYRTLADKYGFLVIYPNANSSDSCFDIHSEGTLKHDGGGDSKSIISMVKYVLKNYNADSTRVFVTGHSSGGMMTNVMIGSYPEVFKAGSASAGVPFGCFAGADAWSDACAKGQIIKTPQEWGDLVRTAYPGYNGPRPRVQLWHGSNDDILYPVNFDEEIDQWTNVLGVSRTPTSTETNKPLPKYVRTRYTNNSGVVMVEAIKAVDQGHNCTISEDSVIAFFGLDKIVPTRDGPMENRKLFMGTSMTVEESSNGIFHFFISSRPGQVAVNLYSLNGIKIRTVAEQNSPTGLIRLSWNATAKDKSVIPQGMYVLSLKINGAHVAACRTALFVGR